MQDVWEPFQGSDLLNALTPERGTPQQPPKVRTLGWDSLAIDYTFLCKAVAASLDALNVPHSQVSLEQGLGCAIVAQPPSDNTVTPEELSITIHVSSADQEGKCTVSIRRTRGSAFRFNAFYTAFRKEFAGRIGMGCPTQLSQYSPMIRGRARAPPSSTPAMGWERRGPPQPQQQQQSVLAHAGCDSMMCD